MKEILTYVNTSLNLHCSTLYSNVCLMIKTCLKCNNSKEKTVLACLCVSVFMRGKERTIFLKCEGEVGENLDLHFQKEIPDLTRQQENKC